MKAALFGGVVAGAMALASAALAHGMLQQATPRAGSTVRAAPPAVRLTFSEKIEPAFSAIEVSNAAGERVDRGDLTLDAKTGQALQVGLAPLEPGTYTVKWRAVAVDTHATTGSFTFTVRPH
jgi:methionine-rich copper-binding protein CopC